MPVGPDELRCDRCQEEAASWAVFFLIDDVQVAKNICLDCLTPSERAEKDRTDPTNWEGWKTGHPLAPVIPLHPRLRLASGHGPPAPKAGRSLLRHP